MPTLDSVRFDTTNWQPVSRDRWTAEWQNDHGDDLVLMLELGPPGIPATGDVRPALLESLTRISGGQVHLLAVDRRPVAGVAAVVALLRARRGTGWTYGAAVMLPFTHFTYSLVLVAGEHGVTGVREAIAALFQHVMGQEHTTPLTPEQEQMLDAALPAHPQARVRTYLDELLGSLTLGPDLATAVTWPPVRLPSASAALEIRDGAIHIRRPSGRLVGRFPLAAVRAAWVEVVWSRGELVLGLGAAVGAVLALVFLNGWWAVGGAVLAGFFSLLGLATCRPWAVAIDTAAGTFRWPVFEPKVVAEAFRDQLVVEERPCLLSS